MKSAIFTFLVAFALGCGVALAKSPSSISGMGAMPCASYAGFFKDEPSATRDLLYTWAIGYMSGLNNQGLGTDGEFTDYKMHDLKDIDTSDLVNAVNLFCLSNPLLPTYVGITRFYNKLPVIDVSHL